MLHFLVASWLVLCFDQMVEGLPGDHPDPALIQPFHPKSSPPTTIPAFPEQSDLTSCPLDLPDALYPAVARACPSSGGVGRRWCCPTLAAWLYAAYARAALRPRPRPAGARAEYDAMPVLPDDSETCVEEVGRALRGKGVELPRPNATCDLVYCYCGVRLHSLACPAAFGAAEDGRLVAGEKVRRLERDCRFGAGGNRGPAACNKCLHSLYQLNEENTANGTTGGGDGGGAGDRKSKMRSRDCQLMGLTWLLATDRAAYMPVVTQVLRAFMAGSHGLDATSELHSCSMTGGDMPYAVDSAELGEWSSSLTIHRPFSSCRRHHILVVFLVFFIQFLF